jgi:hypothetical protein
VQLAPTTRAGHDTGDTGSCTLITQVYDSDYLGGGVKFKVDGLLWEALSAGLPAYDRDYERWELMFSDSTPLYCSSKA